MSTFSMEATCSVPEDTDETFECAYCADEVSVNLMAPYAGVPVCLSCAYEAAAAEEPDA